MAFVITYEQLTTEQVVEYLMLPDGAMRDEMAICFEDVDSRQAYSVMKPLAIVPEDKRTFDFVKKHNFFKRTEEGARQ